MDVLQFLYQPGIGLDDSCSVKGWKHCGNQVFSLASDRQVGAYRGVPPPHNMDQREHKELTLVDRCEEDPLRGSMQGKSRWWTSAGAKRPL